MDLSGSSNLGSNETVNWLTDSLVLHFFHEFSQNHRECRKTVTTGVEGNKPTSSCPNRRKDNNGLVVRFAWRSARSMQ